ncbi:hypothetical protein GNI_039950 [Gregarina niphandrodes]|uniref:Uncharacterized protein n=1 Tax=Gregarina niphandrodes TaxID=110365 RepID=A0A023BAD5_GRENI|nr:hypothetical protein GNI_039950 [Gregarina niphandrodes]EZG78195.1 hypothetical protein GNI_039950 [Gregarina niphandrodes]|eukprot:XP_011129415.1 hypothetical protein GNI_039950 [Gregarina niphandrodes]
MHPDATHYSLVSETTIPLKPFKHIWGQLAADPRSKVDLFCLEHREGYPKHSQWLTLTREHAKALVAPHRLWEVGANRLIRGTCPTLCGANDEYWPVRIISENLRISGYDEWERQFEARSMAHPLGTLNWHTFIDWNLYNPRSVQSALGEASGRSWSHPTTFTSVSGRFLRTLVAADNVWFARKMTNDLLPVKSCNESPLMFLGDALRAELRSPKRPQQAPSKMPFDFGPHMDCALVDFLSLLLQAGPWAPVTGHDIPEYLKGYITTQEDRLDLGRGGLFMVRDAQGQQIDHGLDALLAGTLRGSNWTGGPGLEKGITVELRPLFAYELDTLAEAVQRRMVFNEEVPDRSVQEQGAAVEEFEALTTRDEQHWDVDLRSDL